MTELEKTQTALFTIIKNNFVMPTGIKLGKSKEEINRMSYATMVELTNLYIDYVKAFEEFSEGKRKYFEKLQ